VRAAFGIYTSLLDFCRKVDRRFVSRHDRILLIKLGAFDFTGLTRAQLSVAEQYYASAADLMRASDNDPAGTSPLEEDLASGAIKYVQAIEWQPDVIAAYELAHLGFYTASPLGQTNGLRPRNSALSVSPSLDYPDKRQRMWARSSPTCGFGPRRAKMAAAYARDGTGAIECAVFPNAYERLAETASAVVAARGRLRGRPRAGEQQETTDPVFIDEVQILGGTVTQLSALAVAIAEQQPDEWSALGR
jgi:DNA polymerase III alpha subunit